MLICVRMRVCLIGQNRLVPGLERNNKNKKAVPLSKIVSKLEIVMEMINEESAQFNLSQQEM